MLVLTNLKVTGDAKMMKKIPAMIDATHLSLEEKGLSQRTEDILIIRERRFADFLVCVLRYLKTPIDNDNYWVAWPSTPSEIRCNPTYS